MINRKKLIHKNVADVLLQWFKKHKRDFPWRKNKSPYSVWISEIMLQQTVTKTVIPFFEQWMKKYPNINKLANATERKILTLWEGLGYYNRARNILKSAKIIINKHNGKIPNTYHDLIQLPGVGNYTASAILSIAYNKSYPVVDANVIKVVRRLLGWEKWKKEREKKIYEYLKEIMPSEKPGEFNEAFMELGQLICLSQNPLCSECPIQNCCYSYKNKIQNEILEKRVTIHKQKKTTILLLLYNNTIFITKKEKGILKGLWTVPSINRNTKSAINKFIKKNISSQFLYLGKLPSKMHHYTKFMDTLQPLILIPSLNL